MQQEGILQILQQSLVSVQVHLRQQAHPSSDPALRTVGAPESLENTPIGPQMESAGVALVRNWPG